ncbi:MAG: type II CRISPR RNA-guided endonuclease Cas9 [Clostridiales bacterium]|nr:type II CRISPR RNA-guided endonuclease Cas9 [Clostridiales bacterium]
MKNNKNYYLGLDIGTDSVGYAVTDENYDLVKCKGEPMWGVHLFESAKLNDERRSFRTARRRLDRRQQRVKLTQELFALEIAKVDANFYQRIKQSSWWREDTQDSRSLFCDEDYTDTEYYREYPTIHHLISDLIHNPAPHDIRLVYLACAWLVAHRGHFFSDVSKENIGELLDIQSSYDKLMDCFEEEPWPCNDKAQFCKILQKKIGVNSKYKELCALLFSASKAPKTEPVEEEPFISAELMLKLLCGGKVSLKDLFNNSDYADIESFSLDSDDEKLAEILAVLGDDADLIKVLKELYDCAVLADILSSAKYISDKKVAVYEIHKSDLSLLKRLVKKYAPKKYAEVFRDENKPGYASYVKAGKADDFSKYIKGIFKDVTVDAQDQAAFADMISRLETKSFCPKQVNSDNRVIPYQVYWVELEKILENAAKYLPFLHEVDEQGYVTKDKLLSIMEFRVPYFVGPLNSASKFAWIKRKAEGKIYPWNFEEKVDLEASEQAFIDNMTNTCTYLPDADVMPKNSLLHEKFQVLNEINTLSINGERISVEVKQRLYQEHFMTRKKVTKKSIKTFLQLNNLYSKDDLETLSGIDDVVKSSLFSHIAFKNLLNNKQLTIDNVEDIICRRTYTEDSSRFAKWLKDSYPHLSEEDRRYISNLKFKDFARLSKELLCNIYGTEADTVTGEAVNMIDRMWNENLNLMEILSDRYTYRGAIEKHSQDYYGKHPKSLDERMTEMCLSNAVKRPIIRTLDIVSDVVKVRRQAPKKIFVEMARGGKPEDKGVRTKSRYQQLRELYKKCRLEDAREMEAQLDAMGNDRDNRLRADKLFLYYLQLGKSMYSGKVIDIERISDKTYDIDHIYPQSKVKDDSVLNNKVLVLSEENGAKGDKYPISGDVRDHMAGWWKLLFDNGLITQEKYKRLIRHTPFDENEEWCFINRQLVETRQSTKAVAALLNEKYPDSEIVYVKAGIVSEFRQNFDMYKSRTVNDLHHAKDAYLNIVVGNVYHEQFTRKWFIENRSKYNLKISTLFSRRIEAGGRLIWNGSESIGKITHIVRDKNTVHLTRYAFCRKGGFFDQMPVKAAEGLIPMKKGMKTEKYGGYNKSAASFFVLIRYSVGTKTDVMMTPIELLYAKEFLEDAEFARQYAKNAIQKIIKKPIDSVEFPLGMRQVKINTMLELDGMRMCISGKSSGGKCIIVSLTMPLIVGYRWEKYMKRMESFINKKKEAPHMQNDEKYDGISVEKNLELYDFLTEKLSSSVYVKRPANPVETLKEGRDRFLEANIFDQTKCLLQILSVFGRVSGGCDLRLLGGAGKAASTGNFSSSLSNWKKNYADVRIIDQSASGLFETRSENLLELL